MQKLLGGIEVFRRESQAGYQKKFASLAYRQQPDALLIACCDSRVVPNVFASADPGDLFVVRNIGNCVPSYSASTFHDVSVGAVLEWAIEGLSISDIIVCGHSDCGAMHALLGGLSHAPPLMQQWLAHALPVKDSLGQQGKPSVDDQAKANVLFQIEHLQTYPLVQRQFARQALRLHGWFFDIPTGDVFEFDPDKGEFTVLNAAQIARVRRRMELHAQGSPP